MTLPLSVQWALRNQGEVLGAGRYGMMISNGNFRNADFEMQHIGDRGRARRGVCIQTGEAAVHPTSTLSTSEEWKRMLPDPGSNPSFHYEYPSDVRDHSIHTAGSGIEARARLNSIWQVNAEPQRCTERVAQVFE